jgi:hypothetical protein
MPLLQMQIVRKRQWRFVGFDDKILALYSRGLSTRDISAHLQEIYGVPVGRDLISRVTDGMMDDVRDWAKRPLERLPDRVPGLHGPEDPRGRHGPAPREYYRCVRAATACLRTRPPPPDRGRGNGPRPVIVRSPFSTARLLCRNP